MRSTLLASGFVGLVTVSVTANILQNGSFEEPLQDPHFSTPRAAGNGLPGWTIAGGGIDHAYLAWMAADGNRSVSLNWVGASTLTQAVETDAGQTYRVRFAMAAEIYGGPPLRTLDVTWNNDIVGSFTFEYTGQGPDTMGWVYHELDLVATGLDVLGITSTTPANYGPAVDDVSLTRACVADFAEPFGMLDFFDILEFLSLFHTMDPAADVAAPTGVWDFFDVLQFLALFDAGCP